MLYFVLMKSIFFYLLSLLFIVAGLLHFLKPRIYLKIMPRWMPFPHAVVLASGVMEIVLGVCLLFPDLTRIAAWGIIIFLILVFPANIVMAMKYYAKKSPYLWIALIRLPLQFLLIWWAWLYT